MKPDKYALGCAFSLRHLFINFPYKKLKLTCEDCIRINGDPHRDKLVKKVFKECYKIIINDVIDNNVTFWLPTGAKKCNIHMLRIQGSKFKNMRKVGKWRDIDILESNFTGFQLGFYMYGVRDPRIKNIYVNKELRDKITANANKGMQYGDSNKDKTIHDYYEIIYSKFPEISQEDIKRILKYSFKSLYLNNSYGGDVVIQDGSFWSYIGFLKSDPLEHYYYYIKKLSVKIRVLYKRLKIQWDGYYYFALSLWKYDKFIGTSNKRGRPKKKFTFENITLYQILDECKINENNRPYIFRIPYITLIKYKFFIPKLVTDKAELIITREPLKFKDILISENEYDTL